MFRMGGGDPKIPRRGPQRNFHSLNYLLGLEYTRHKNFSRVLFFILFSCHICKKVFDTGVGGGARVPSQVGGHLRRGLRVGWKYYILVWVFMFSYVSFIES